MIFIGIPTDAKGIASDSVHVYEHRYSLKYWSRSLFIFYLLKGPSNNLIQFFFIGIS